MFMLLNKNDYVLLSHKYTSPSVTTEDVSSFVQHVSNVKVFHSFSRRSVSRNVGNVKVFVTH